MDSLWVKARDSGAWASDGWARMTGGVHSFLIFLSFRAADFSGGKAAINMQKRARQG